MFDENFYLKTYPDVKQAVASGAFKDAFSHFMTFGRHEGRKMTEDVFDEQYYLSMNSDVKMNGYKHFLKFGYKEDRWYRWSYHHFKKRIDIIRKATLADLQDTNTLTNIIIDLGVGPTSSFGKSSYPKGMETGKGLRIYQNPMQMAQYLIFLADKHIESYIELGVYCGGTFILTVEYLNRFNKLKTKIAVDKMNWRGSNLPRYKNYEDFEFWQIDTKSEDFKNMIQEDKFDLAFIDADHEYDFVKSDYNIIKPRTRMVALHDVGSPIICPDVVKFWQEIKDNTCVEFLDNTNGYTGMGIGVK